jgi:hypothetical protein
MKSPTAIFRVCQSRLLDIHRECGGLSGAKAASGGLSAIDRPQFPGEDGEARHSADNCGFLLLSYLCDAYD